MPKIFTFRKGGIHPGDSKITADSPIKRLPLPESAVVMLAQSIGRPAICAVKPKDLVKRGDIIGKADGPVSSNVHSPISGIVRKVEKVRNIAGLWQEAVIIEKDPADNTNSTDCCDEELFTPRSIKDVEALKPTDIIDIVREAGIVGLGGAAFPTAAKLAIPEGKHIDTVLINGAECEPYLTCDDALMREKAEEIILGTRLLMRATGAKRAVIGIENNKMTAYRKINEAVRHHKDIEAVLLKKKYPQGSEKQLIRAITGREIPPGRLPSDVNVLVDNVATAYAVYEAVYLGKPLIERVVTVTGPEVSTPGNFLAAIGISMNIIVDTAGGFPDNTGKVIAGGPMMGHAVSQTDSPSVKGLSGIVIFPEKMSERKEEEPCIRCAKCVEACPMGLEPYLLMPVAQHKDWEMALEHNVLSCLECGCCSYVCPASRPLLDWIMYARREIKKL